MGQNTDVFSQYLANNSQNDDVWVNLNHMLREVPKLNFGQAIQITEKYKPEQIRKSFRDAANGPKLRKALSAVNANMTDLGTLTGVRAVTVENIDPIIKMLVGTHDQLKLLKMFRQRDITTVHDQWIRQNQLGAYVGGSMAHGTALPETVTPPSTDVSWQRVVDYVKFFRSQAQISHVAQNVETVTDIFAAADQGKALEMGRAMSLTILYGNEARNPYEFNGLIQTLRSRGHVFDCRRTNGTPGLLDEILMNDACAKNINQVDSTTGYGPQLMGSHMIMPQTVKRYVDTLLLGTGRYSQNDVEISSAIDVSKLLQNQAGLALGNPAAGLRSNYAYEGRLNMIDLMPWAFPDANSVDMKAPTAYSGVPANQLVPAGYVQPTIAGATATAVVTAVGVTTAGSQWDSVRDAGWYGYTFAGTSEYGQTKTYGYGAGSPIAGGVDYINSDTQTIITGGAITLTITNANADTVSGLRGYRVFRTKGGVGASWAAAFPDNFPVAAPPSYSNPDARWIGDVAINAAGPNGNSGAVYVDLNDVLPGSNMCVIVSNYPQAGSIDFTQLLPFVRVELPFGLNGMSFSYVYFWYAYLRIPLPEGHILLTNVSSAPGEIGSLY